MELNIQQVTLPSVTTNYETVKNELTDYCQQFAGIKVLQENVPACKDIRKSLRSLRGDINSFRLDVKKQLTAPISEFEEQCKGLIEVVDEVLVPINDGIKEWDKVAKGKKDEKAREIIAQVCFDRNFPCPEIIDIKINSGTTQEFIREETARQIDEFLHSQQTIERNKKIVKSMLDSENEQLSTKMSIDDFVPRIETGENIEIILNDIKREAVLISKAEKVGKEGRNNSFLVEVYDDIKEADAVLKLLQEHGYMARIV